MHDGPKVHTGPFSHTMRIERLGLENAKKAWERRRILDNFVMLVGIRDPGRKKKSAKSNEK